MISPREWSADFWAAVAAAAAAIAAVSSVAWQRRATLQTASPELVLADYGTDSSSGMRSIRASTVKNVGTGVANHIHVVVPAAVSGGFVLGGGELIAILPPGASAKVKFEVIMAAKQGSELGPGDQVTAVLVCKDVHGWRHEFPFTYFVTAEDVGLTEALAPELKLGLRRHWSVSPMRAWIEERVPGLVPRVRRYLNRGT